MKPDNIKRRTAPRRPKGYYGNWERHQIVKAKELKMKIRHVRKRIDRYVKRHPEHMRLKTVLLLGITMKRYGFSIRRMMGELYTAWQKFVSKPHPFHGGERPTSRSTATSYPVDGGGPGSWITPV